MATITINGVEHTLPDGERLNAIQAARRFGVEIPYYCWHPALSVVANCRMCEVEVGNKNPETGEIKMVPKLVPGCQTPAKDGTVIVTDSDRVKYHQSMIMEYLLLNHPLDCPVCDQAGQCGLQDYSYTRGQAVHRFLEVRNVNPRKDVSERIQLNMDRCIMCTRCVRFAREITGTAELGVERRGSHSEIVTFPGQPLDNTLAGNVVDLCPVGALLDKDFLHHQRYWYNDKHPSICARCSTGCNITVEENKGRIWRYRARYNPLVNDHWICDEGRYSYKAANDPSLMTSMYVREGADLNPAPIDQAIRVAQAKLKDVAESKGRVLGVLSPFLTNEEAYLLASYLKGLSDSVLLALGPIPVQGEDQTIHPDQKKGRTGDTSFVVPRPFTIRAEKCPNRRGVESILTHFQLEVVTYDALLERCRSERFALAYVTGGGHEPAHEGPAHQPIRDASDFLIVQDPWPTDLAGLADVVLASATFAEKAGTYVNAQGLLQYAGASLPPREGSVPDLDLVSILAERGEGPVNSAEVLAELARELPVFANAASQAAKLPRYGLPLEDGAAPISWADQTPYVDPWHAPRGRPTLARY